MNNFKNKYLKYKLKYLTLKRGGALSPCTPAKRVTKESCMSNYNIQMNRIYSEDELTLMKNQLSNIIDEYNHFDKESANLE